MIQIDMPMPENCYKCLLNSFCEPCEGHNNICVLTQEDLGWYRKSNGKVYDHSNGTHDARHPDCPLREVKEGQKDKYVAWLEKQVIDQTKKSYPEMVLAIYDAGYAYAAIHHLLKLLEESKVEPDA